MSINQKKLNQISQEIQAGKISKAISRLEGLIRFNPNEQIYREKLGEIYYSVKWLERAGKYWFLTEREFRKEKAIKIFENQHGNSATQILTALKFRGDVDKLPQEVRSIYRRLEQESLSVNRYIPKYSTNEKRPRLEYSETMIDKLWSFGCLLVFVIIIGLAIIGTIDVFRWIF
jgi:hypothetical protein